MIDLRQAIKVRDMQTRPSDFKIGRIRNTFETSTISGHRAGNIVLYRREGGDTCTIETPMSDKWLEEQKNKGSFLTTICTCVGFPGKYIEEIKV